MTEAPLFRRVAVGAALACATGLVWAAPLTPQEAKGKALYVQGIGAKGKPIKAYIGDESSAVDGDTVPCAGCHGEDGRGRPEGGIVPTDVTWSNLTKPYGHHHGNYRQHPAFTERSLATALARGTDPAGNPLDSAMPRFALSKADLNALGAYLKRLDTAPIPGVDDTRIRLATVLPLSGAQEAAGRDMQAVLQAYLDAVNAGSGLYNRRLELEVVAMETNAEATAAKLRKLLDAEQVFAVLAPYAPEQEETLSALLEQAQVPYLAPLSDFPALNSRSGFFLAPGIETRAKALLDYAGKRLDKQAPQLTLIYPDAPGYRQAAVAMAADAAARGWPAPRQANHTPDAESPVLKESVLLQPTDAVLFLGGENTLRAWSAQRREGLTQPLLLLAGIPQGRLTQDLPEADLERLALALPFAPDALKPEAMEPLRGLQHKAGVGDRSLYPESFAIAGTSLLVQALKQAGRELSRRKLVEALENLRQVPVPPWPDLTFSPSHRIGLRSLPVYTVDRKTGRLLPANPP
ncbi:cytochrome c/ABC transporter substrate-binding protein [Methyloterricola oryzae]|uniref:cytochrome c/ABC transporter substrate-binding protein n=1 Tax=Methyloterricola oryzae TaxID=1495050 RepID=UPI0005EB5B64|nr:ABC transporter substrate-binding protein [Methyloterricola oryzae]